MICAVWRANSARWNDVHRGQYTETSCRQWFSAARQQVRSGRGVAVADRESSLISLRADATIDRKRVPGNVPGLVGKQPDDGIGDLFGLADPPHWDK